MIKADLHNHTNISHGTASVGEMYASAIQKGLSWFGLSEHSPLPHGYGCALYTGDLEGDFPKYCQEVLNLKKEKASPVLLLGLELDWLPGRRDWMEALVTGWPFDYVLGSLHFLDGYSVGKPDNWNEKVEIQERFGRFAAYFSEMASMAASGLVQGASHPDFTKLRAWRDFQLWLATPQSRDSLAQALQSLRDHDVAMEVSSAGLRQPFHEPYPCPAIMSLAADLGVTIFFGSDAHAPADVASHFDQLESYALAHGFRQYRVFQNRQPLDLPLH